MLDAQTHSGDQWAVNRKCLLTRTVDPCASVRLVVAYPVFSNLITGNSGGFPHLIGIAAVPTPADT